MLTNSTFAVTPEADQEVNAIASLATKTDSVNKLVKLGCDVFASRRYQDAMSLFDGAHTVLTSTTSATATALLISDRIAFGKRIVEMDCMDDGNDDQAVAEQPDLYQEDGCDVGPRTLNTPVAPTSQSRNAVLLECVILFNKALTYQSMRQSEQARQLYEIVVYSVQNSALFLTSFEDVAFLELAMRTNNNLGLLIYNQSENLALACFTAAAEYGQKLTISKTHRTEYATALSNWCRVHWMNGDNITDSVYESLQEVLRVRSTVYSWDHPDVAAARYNLAVADYSRKDRKQAVSHLKEYLAAAKTITTTADSDSSATTEKSLDAVPAVVYLLIIQNEERSNPLSQELVRALRTLQDTRQDEGPESSDVASVLNFVGTLLFHQKDWENALLFFMEELRVEEKRAVTNPGAVSAAATVTCNNIGRILQEIGRNEEAIKYYELCLEGRNRTGVADAPSLNLYSSVWYNLGLIHDKLSATDKAIESFSESLKLREVLLGPCHPDVACLLYNIGVLQMEQKKLSDASVAFRKTIQIRQSSGARGQLSDKHVISTMEKLASLLKADGNIQGALEVTKDIVLVQETTTELDMAQRMKDSGATLRSVAELHHARNDMNDAVAMATASVFRLRLVAEANRLQHQIHVDSEMEDVLLFDLIANVEQLVSSLLLLGSLHHELCEPVLAEFFLREAANSVLQTKQAVARISQVPSSLCALSEVTSMLAKNHCAPQA